MKDKDIKRMLEYLFYTMCMEGILDERYTEEAHGVVPLPSEEELISTIRACLNDYELYGKVL